MMVHLGAEARAALRGLRPGPVPRCVRRRRFPAVGRLRGEVQKPLLAQLACPLHAAAANRLRRWHRVRQSCRREAVLLSLWSFGAIGKKGLIFF